LAYPSTEAMANASKNFSPKPTATSTRKKRGADGVRSPPHILAVVDQNLESQIRTNQV
jgi:hypothetical protein